MTTDSKPAFFAGIDWATQKHDVCVIDSEGRVLGERVFRADAEGLGDLAGWVASFEGDAGDIWIAIETPHGAVVDTLLERDLRVHSLNPKQLDRFRDRFTVSGAKDDRRDARVLADSLRTDLRAFRVLSVIDPRVIELREYWRMTEDLQHDRNRQCNRLREQLRRYFPQALEVETDLSKPWVLDLLTEIPTPAIARKRRRATVDRILRTRRIKRVTADEVLATLRKPAVCTAPGIVEAATAHVKKLIEQLRLTVRQHAECRRALDHILAQLAEHDAGDGRAGELRDAAIMRSFPGIGTIVQTALLAGGSRPVEARDYHALRALMGIAPVTRRSGKRRQVLMRQACDSRMRNAAYHWARVASQRDPHWRALYKALRKRGHGHGRACRGVTDRMLSVLVVMLQTRTTYDPTRLGQKLSVSASAA